MVQSPANLVRTKEDEKHWREAKKRAKDEGHAGDWKYVVSIFERMSGGKEKSGVRKHEMMPIYLAVNDAWAADLGRSRSRARLVVPTNDEQDRGTETPSNPQASDILRSRSGMIPTSPMPERINNGPTERLRFDAGGESYSVTYRIAAEGTPAGRITMRDAKGRVLFETTRDFAGAAEILTYCRKFIEDLAPSPTYPATKFPVTGGTQEPGPSDSELQVANLQANDPEPLGYPTGRDARIVLKV